MSFNLIGKPWIPVLFDQSPPGEHRLVGLRELYEKAEKIRDLALNPPQRVSVMRLLICITQAALDGPADENDWRHCRNRIVPESLRYLEHWHDCFDLFGSRPFLQVPELEPKPEIPCDKLNFGLSVGNNHTLYDHEGASSGRCSPPHHLAMNLLTYQCFSPGGLIGETTWSNRRTGRKSNHAPCVEESPLLTLLRGENLLSAIHWNLVPRSVVKQQLAQLGYDFGRPLWEEKALHPDSEDSKQWAGSYLGRLVPLSRAVRLQPDSPLCTLANGIEYPKLPRVADPMATVVVARQTGDREEYKYVRLSLDKHPWRDLAAVLTLARIGVAGGPWMLRNAPVLESLGVTSFDLWVGGLAVDRAKFLDSGEWVFAVPVKLLGEPCLLAYQNGVKWANIQEGALRDAVRIYCHELKLESAPYTRAASSRYWSLLDADYRLLIDAAVTQPQEHDGGSPAAGSAPADSLSQDISPMANWRNTCRRVAYRALAEVCPTLTPRQVQAYAKASGKLQRSAQTKSL